MNDDLIAAAKRLRCGEYENEDCATLWNFSRQRMNDNCYLADALLPELDDTPVDEAWLRSAGFVTVPNTDYVVSPFNRHGVGLAVRFRNGERVVIINDDHEIPISTLAESSRGQVRTLCRALNIELKEQG